MGPGRAYGVIERNLRGGRAGVIPIGDRYETQWKMPLLANQLCLPHLQRECNSLGLRHPGCAWIRQLGDVL